MTILKVGISSRALFDMNESHKVFKEKGIEKYAKFQKKHEKNILEKGVAFPLVEKLLSMNTKKEKIVEVILLSRNSSDTGLRIFNSIEKYQLEITRAVFSGGESPFPYVDALDIDLFLSADVEDVKKAIKTNIAAAHIFTSKVNFSERKELRIAFDADAVIFSDESEVMYKKKGLKKYLVEEGQSEEPITPGPFNGFLKKLNFIQSNFPVDDCPIRIALVTARAAPAHKRVIKTLRKEKIRIDETFFLGGLAKGKFLKGFNADIFFDDLTENCAEATSHVSTGHVPYGINNT
ncbi:MAG: 5'-nucleotidase [Proteobacteria bacterium]|uniref:5'-nucleotidase n=1 Tax=SAR86 cluster bacterium TaxID=2030880 RepID=A0A937LN84_9GAMM|nr:5'-nucleotidase [SAR86 cluster bacterium]MDA0345169.1 5'-nucleotidase [Pseudomonadota bacterium]